MMVYDWRNGKRVVFLQLVKKGYNMKRSVVFASCLWVSCLFTLSAQKTTIESKEENSLRVMSYNVRNCRGMDEAVDYQRVADIMNRVDPDV